MRLKLIALLFLFSAADLMAQTENTLGMMENIFQASYSNPVAVPQHKVSIGLPGMSSGYAGVTFTGFTFDDVYRKDTLAVDHAINKMRRKNMIYTGAAVDLFHLRVKIRNSYFSFHITDRVESRISLPKDLFKLAWEGNYQFAGKTIDLTSLGLDVNYYREFGIGYFRENKKWTFGGQIKLLQGLANAHVRNKVAKLGIADPTYDFDGRVNTTLYSSGMNPDNFDDYIVKDHLTTWSNKGLGLNAAVGYKLNDKWTFSAAINDVGFIRWHQDTRHYSVKGQAVFKGIPLDLTKDDVGLGDLNYQDSVDTKFKYNEFSGAYTTWIIPKMYLRGKYNLFKKTSINACVSFEKYKAFHSTATVAAYQEVGKFFSIVLSYSMMYSNFHNAGVGFMIKPGPFQIYFVTDNLWRRYTNYSDVGITVPTSAKTLSARAGLNLVFGRVKQQEKQTSMKK